jgi:hypothetical protein
LAEDLSPPRDDPGRQQDGGEQAHPDGNVDQQQAGRENPRDEHQYRPGHEDSAETDH